MKFRSISRSLARPALALGLAAAATWAAGQLGAFASTASPTCADVVARMVASNLGRHQALHAYSAIRSYHVVYDGLGHEEADMKVRMDYREPGPKQLTVISESGSGLLRHHVLDPLLETERREEQIEAEKGPAITPQNYDFDLVATPESDPLGDYVLRARPHKGDRFLFRGRIWVDPGDYGIVQVEGEPTDDHSWWVSDTEFSFHNQRVGDFWLPRNNHVTCHVRFFGHAVLDITYGEFEISSASPVPRAGAEAAIPDPPAPQARCPGCNG